MGVTIAQWAEIGTKMIWSIYDRESSNEFDSKKFTSDLGWQTAYGQIELDLSAPEGVPDGIYSVLHTNYRHAVGYCVGTSYGLRIENGKFVPESTDKACYYAVGRSLGMSEKELIAGIESEYTPFNYVFIESFVWYKSLRALEVQTGS